MLSPFFGVQMCARYWNSTIRVRLQNSYTVLCALHYVLYFIVRSLLHDSSFGCMLIRSYAYVLPTAFYSELPGQHVIADFVSCVTGMR
ncbi:hypothetical protein CPSG_04882 [Coccidioides posadasii str. Silveira]|uniref:Uncharacterized protein n=1 Tax=Coccidioides posadasii (strain RMSCC 757 / Silveira) TaxID=443226 RepID=E9D5K2_COCPS|nr:hypothetical protein CPSG_04882 [Coccidioides posadasii str. Silveira]